MAFAWDQIIGGALAPILGEGGVLDQAIYTRDERDENAYLQTLANANLTNAQANQSTAIGLSNKQLITPELIKLVVYIMAGLIIILLLIFLVRKFSK